MRKYRRKSPTDTKVREEEVPQILEDLGSPRFREAAEVWRAKL